MGGPVPPPPPPMNINRSNNDTNNKPSGPPRLPVANDNRGALMESIRLGAKLKKVDTTKETISNSSGDSRTDLMSEIKGGFQLRPVESREPGNRSSGDGGGGGTDALADALKRALEQRKLKIRDSSSSESETSDNDDWSD